LEAVSYAWESVTHADQSDDRSRSVVMRTLLADAINQAGKIVEAEQWFRQAEEMQKKRHPEYQYLYSLQGYHFCDLLLSQGKYKDVMERVEKSIEGRHPSDSILSISLESLALGRAWMMKAAEEGSRDFANAMNYLNRAVKGLRESGDQDMLALPLIKRAECYRHMKQFSKAWADLKEVEEIAELGDMKLHLCDFHLEAGRLCLAEENDEQADHHFNIAKKMIQQTGYHRRDKEVERVRREENSKSQIPNHKQIPITKITNKR
jgi:tetratricopeptide (TPR) repeat protein